MAEPAASAAASAATTMGLTLFGFALGVHPDLLIAGLVGGIAAILTIEAMTVKQRLAAVLTATMVSGLIGPLLVFAAPKAFPDFLRGVDTSALRLAVGFLRGVLAYRVLLPALIRRAEKELGEKK